MLNDLLSPFQPQLLYESAHSSSTTIYGWFVWAERDPLWVSLNAVMSKWWIQLPSATGQGETRDTSAAWVPISPCLPSSSADWITQHEWQHMVHDSSDIKTRAAFAKISLAPPQGIRVNGTSSSFQGHSKDPAFLAKMNLSSVQLQAHFSLS